MPVGGLVAPPRARSLVAFRTCPVLPSHVGEPGKAKYTRLLEGSVGGTLNSEGARTCHLTAVPLWGWPQGAEVAFPHY